MPPRLQPPQQHRQFLQLPTVKLQQPPVREEQLAADGDSPERAGAHRPLGLREGGGLGGAADGGGVWGGADELGGLGADLWVVGWFGLGDFGLIAWFEVGEW